MTLSQPRYPTQAIAVGATVALAVATLPVAHVWLPSAALSVPMGMVIAAVAEIATCVIVLVLYTREPRMSSALLAAVYLGVAVLSVGYAVAVPLAPSQPPLLPVAPQVAIDLLLVKWSICAVAIVGYVALRRSEPDVMAERPARLPLRMLIVALVAGVAIVALIVRAGERMPGFVQGRELALFDPAALRDESSSLALVVLFACVLAVVWAFGMHVRNGVDAGVAVTSVAIVIEVLLGFVDPRRFVVGWYTARLLCVPASMFVLVGALHDLLGWRTRALDLAGQLAGERRVAERHSHRLETLWNLASQPELGGDAFLIAVLDQASTALHPGADVTGAVSHLEGAEIVLDVGRQAGGAGSTLPPGTRVPIEQTFLADVLRAGGTRSWSNPRVGVRPKGMWEIAGRPWQGFIGTPVRVGSTQYFLSFVTTVPMVEPFTPEDHAYVETVAAFCAMRLQQREQLQRMQHQSLHDALTGLLNRAGFRRAVNDVLATGATTAIALVDIDGFAELNETHGHGVADHVLIDVGSALASRAGERGVVARLGGDVFAAMLPDADDREHLEVAVERLFSAFSAPFAVREAREPARVTVTAGIGVAVAPQDGTDVERLLARAGGAVQTTKSAGGGRYAFFDRRVEDAFARVRRTQNDLARALVRDEFVLYFQPHVSIATGRVTGAEALIRWQHPERGLLAPAEFIPFAEEHGMLPSIAPWIVRETVRAARAWREIAGTDFRVWFNLSAAELHDPQLVARLRSTEEQFAGVGVEITESTAMRDVQATARNLSVFRRAGMRIALDDFGTGYSSLAQLKRLPIDVVKIDRSFTAGLPDDPHDVAIVEAVLGLARRYGFATVAEGVESQRQAAFLNDAGCAIAQGYLYAPPLPRDAFTDFLQGARNSVADAPYHRA